jgi:hypothetical protein
MEENCGGGQGLNWAVEPRRERECIGKDLEGNAHGRDLHVGTEWCHEHTSDRTTGLRAEI